MLKMRKVSLAETLSLSYIDTLRANCIEVILLESNICEYLVTRNIVTAQI